MWQCLQWSLHGAQSQRIASWSLLIHYLIQFTLLGWALGILTPGETWLLPSESQELEGSGLCTACTLCLWSHAWHKLHLRETFTEEKRPLSCSWTERPPRSPPCPLLNQTARSWHQQTERKRGWASCQSAPRVPKTWTVVPHFRQLPEGVKGSADHLLSRL